MSDGSCGVQVLYAASGERVGVYIPAVLWDEIESEVAPHVERAKQRLFASVPEEPMADWDLLAAHWDFAYPLEMDVKCGHCANSTSNWRLDDPRKFRLKAASLGGLVVFECQACQARVTKRHFKDTVKVETTPSKQG